MCEKIQSKRQMFPNSLQSFRSVLLWSSWVPLQTLESRARRVPEEAPPAGGGAAEAQGGAQLHHQPPQQVRPQEPAPARVQPRPRGLCSSTPSAHHTLTTFLALLADK